MANLTPEQKLFAIAAILAGSKAPAAAPAGPAPPPGPDWFVPTDAEKAYFATRSGYSAADLDGDRNDPIAGCDGTDTDAFLYAKFGFEPFGKRALWVSDKRTAARETCKQLRDAPDAAAADVIVHGAGAPGVTTEYAQWMVMIAKYLDGTLYTWGKFGTVAEALAGIGRSFASGG